MATENQNFSSRWMFIITAIGSAVGLGNIWRYPFIVYANGGGAFLVPYFIALIIAAFPVLMVEFLVGSRYKGAAPLAFARISKKYEWIGWLPTIVAAMIVYYYVAVLAWAANYVIFATTRAWGDNPGAFFQGDFLGTPASPFYITSINFSILIALVGLWGATYYVCSKGVSSGLEAIMKVVMPFVFIFFIGLAIFSVTLDGGVLGLNALFTPDLSRFTDPRIWVAAFGQVFFSVSACMGIMITFGSYRKRGSEFVNSSLVITFGDSLISMIAAVSIFGILGHMAYMQGVGVADVAASGPGLVFATLPVAFNLMGGMGPVIGTAFFLAVLVAGWSSFVTLSEAMVTPFAEKFNFPRKKAYGIICFSGFFLSVIYSTNVGLLLIGIVGYVLDYALAFGGLMTALVVSWFAKGKDGRPLVYELMDYANEGSIIKAGTWFVVLLKYILPAVIISIMALWIIDLPNSSHAQQPTDVLLVFYGGSAALIIIPIIVFSKLRWRLDVDNYDK